MKAYASYTITLTGSYVDILDAVDFLSSEIDDQDCWGEFSNPCFYSCDDEEDEDDGNDDRGVNNSLSETFDVYETCKYIWLEDLSKLAAELSCIAPCLCFSISGYTTDNSDGSEEMMDYLIDYKNGKLLSRSSCWYIHIYMDEFSCYDAFRRKFSDKYGNARYSEEDYEGFRECAAEWYVLDGGNGEFSTNVPLGEPVRIKLKKPRYS